MKKLTLVALAATAVLLAGCSLLDDQECSTRDDCGDSEVCTVDGECLHPENGDDEDDDDRAPQIDVSDDEIEFGRVEPGQREDAFVTVENEGDGALEIHDIALSDEHDGVYELGFLDSAPGDDESAPREDDAASAPETVEPGESFAIRVTFAPEDELPDEATLSIVSSDPESPFIQIPINATSDRDNECPTADFEARVEGGHPYEPGDVAPGQPLTTVEFDASSSEDEDGSIESYEWTLLDRPSDSSQDIEPNDEVEGELFLDVVGTYVVELSVYDDDGAANCYDTILTIEAGFDGDIHIQLVWDTPGESDEVDEGGADLDLHYLHPEGTWNEAPWDIYSGNMEADWGIQNDSSDDPSLDVDDSDGGPENISHAKPENLTYRTGVYVADDRGFEEAYADVRIYIEGQLAGEFEDKRLDETGTFWEVAEIEWPTGDVEAIDETHDGFPDD